MASSAVSTLEQQILVAAAESAKRFTAALFVLFLTPPTWELLSCKEAPIDLKRAMLLHAC